ncbi:MAG: selenium metabolism-associated LysR family transcriptional regulator [Proteocatella sp.]
MDFKQLESFITIAKYNSFSKAARELYLTQPTLSNHIQNLENELGLLLFDRKGKTIELTSAGKIFKDHAIEIIKKRDSAVFTINDIIGKFDGILELPSSSVPEEYVLPDIIADFSNEYPGIKFKIHHLDSQDVLESISDNKYSMGFIGSKPSNDFESIKVFEDNMVLIGPKINGVSKDTISFEKILDLPLIMREEGSGSGKIFSKELSNRKKSISDLNIVVVTENFSVAKSLVSKNVGYAFIPSSSAKSISKESNICIYDISDFNTIRAFYFIVQKKSVLTPIEIKFLDFITSRFK